MSKGETILRGTGAPRRTHWHRRRPRKRKTPALPCSHDLCPMGTMWQDQHATDAAGPTRNRFQQPMITAPLPSPHMCLTRLAHNGGDTGVRVQLVHSGVALQGARQRGIAGQGGGCSYGRWLRPSCIALGRWLQLSCSAPGRWLQQMSRVPASPPQWRQPAPKQASKPHLLAQHVVVAEAVVGGAVVLQVRVLDCNAVQGRGCARLSFHCAYAAYRDATDPQREAL